LEATGVMNGITALRLFEDLDLIKNLKLTNAISLPGLAEPFWSGPRRQEYVVVEGTWAILERESAFPLQSSKISCDQTAGTCKETIVEFMGSQVSVQEVEYAILSWNATGVRAISSAPLCVDHIIQIQKVEKKGEGEGDHAGHHRSGWPKVNVDEADGVNGRHTP
jgi:hypothetical protein